MRLSNINSDGPEELEARWAILREKIHTNRHWLTHQGVVLKKKYRRRSFWVMRYRITSEGGRQHRHTIYIARASELELVGRVRRVLREFRAEANAARDIAQMAQFASKLTATYRQTRRRQAGGW
jgi:hypothetical protein